MLPLILYGPEFIWETQEEGKDRAIDRINELSLSQQTQGKGRRKRGPL
ncbi:MAG TPA: hypothetical protein VMY43_01075 [Methanothrix sp.]|nr:hypothetical protein [Methanothrix sp.]